MKGVAEFIGFAVVSGALHIGAFFVLPDGAPQSAGDGGAATLSLQSADAQLASLVQSWDAPPVAARVPPPLAAPAPRTAPEGMVAVAAPTALPLPDALKLAPAPEALPRVDRVVPPPRAEAVAQSLRPQTRPPVRTSAPAPKTPAKTQSAAVRTRAEGRGGAGAKGNRGQAPVATLSTAERSTLLARWGAGIRSKIERRVPRGAGQGVVTVQMQVARNGALRGASVLRSSGDRSLDRAALRAVQSAGRFPAAPRKLTDASYTFNLPIRFQ